MPQQSPLHWQVQPAIDPPLSFGQVVNDSTAELLGQLGFEQIQYLTHLLARLLWQRGVGESEVPGFLNYKHYQPTSPFEFGQEMQWAIDRLTQARDRRELVVIWGDFDADGITATSVLWDGLGQFFAQDQHLRYFIPNRLTDSHGLSIHGLDRLAEQGCHLVVTCDTGSTNLLEIEYAKGLGIDIIVTDHHTLPIDRPPVIALINPRIFPRDHPLANLSGVAVAYKLVEALYQTLPDVPQQPLEQLLDLVAIGLIADLVKLTGDCRYLAQRGIEQLQRQTKGEAVRPGVARLLELCNKAGDRPTDISFGLGPRINAVSRIQGDAHFCVEMLTSRDKQRCNQLAEATELANTRRKSLQREVAQQVRRKLEQLDLSTTHVIVLSDPQWAIGVLGLVAGQIAHEYARPTILLSVEEDGDPNVTTPLAKGSARSVNQIDLYELVKGQEHLLHRFGGHPYAAGLNLPVENIPFFADALNRQLRQQSAEAAVPSGSTIQADLTVTVAELGKDLFRTLRLLEPCGIGNPAPKLLVQNGWFIEVRDRNIKDWKGNKVKYIKTEFRLRDDSTEVSFPGVWWEHYRDEVPLERCDAIVELDYNPYKKDYEIRLLAVRPAQAGAIGAPSVSHWILDWRNQVAPSAPADPLRVEDCPAAWSEMQPWFQRAIQEQQHLAVAYSTPDLPPPEQTWQHLIGIAKYLSRTGHPATLAQLGEKLGISDRLLQLGLQTLPVLGFQVASIADTITVQWTQPPVPPDLYSPDVERFLVAVQEEQFQRHYFCQVPLPVIQTMADRAVTTIGPPPNAEPA